MTQEIERIRAAISVWELAPGEDWPDAQKQYADAKQDKDQSGDPGRGGDQRGADRAA